LTSTLGTSALISTLVKVAPNLTTSLFFFFLSSSVEDEVSEEEVEESPFFFATSLEGDLVILVST